jgi:hypothetical protein
MFIQAVTPILGRKLTSSNLGDCHNPIGVVLETENLPYLPPHVNRMDWRISWTASAGARPSRRIRRARRALDRGLSGRL